ncbi:MAG: tRNA (5-methylaminomethyl-2-thiouridine)(34)-methyltransferase MnmD [Flavobacteriales bacterium]|jgi:tRNA U34 5-methylaminomethyl-2-thiouridine-forming methyltransferase MnmC
MDATNLQPEIITTADGSHSLYNSTIDETYHSRHGALQESKYVFIEQGIKQVDKDDLHLLEVGFGTGLNALLTAIYAREHKVKITYHTLETLPLNMELMQSIAVATTIGEGNQDLFLSLHEAAWNEEVAIHDFFILKKIKSSLQDFDAELNRYDLIYYDAFGPRAQPEMWEAALFNKIASFTNENGVFVTYCAKGQVRRDLMAAGFDMTRLPGPPGKREMMRGIKE